MASLEKLVKTIDQLRAFENVTATLDTGSVKKKEIRLLLSNLVDLNCNSNVQNHKDFVSYISPSIDTLIRLFDSKDSDIRLASDEGLYKVIKGLLPLHSNRVLVEFCKQIKKSDSSRVLKLSMNRFAELCHHARPQKRRAYLANLLNAISVIAVRPEEMLHESLAHFSQKVFSVMGLFAFENETKTLLKTFLTNLASHSAIIRRSAATTIAAIISNNRKSDMLLALVVEYLTDLLLITDDNQATTENHVIIGSMVCLKMLLPLFPTSLIENTGHEQQVKTSLTSQQLKSASNLHCVTAERLIQIFEFSIHYSMFSTDHNVVNSSLEVLQQLLKMRTLLLSIPAFHSKHGLHGTRISSHGLLKANSQWNVSPLPVAEESHLLETEVSVNAFGTSGSGADSIDGEVEAPDAEFLGTMLEQKTEMKQPLESDNDILVVEESKETVEESFDQETTLNTTTNTPAQVINIGSLYDSKGYPPLLYLARHLVHHFLLTDQKGILKSDRLVRVSVKSLALNCLVHIGSLNPQTWNTFLSEPSIEGRIAVLDVLRYSSHDDPQLRGQAALLACAVLSSVFAGYTVTVVDVKELMHIVDDTLKDRETSACRLALQGVQPLLPMALEGSFCLETISLLESMLTLSANPYWLVKVDLLEAFTSIPWVALEFGMQKRSNHINLPSFLRTFFDSTILPLIGDEDHRVRNAVSTCLVGLVRTWTTSKTAPDIVRVKCLTTILTTTNFVDRSNATFSGIPLPINGLAESFRDAPSDGNITENIAFVVDELIQTLATSDSKFTKMGCIHSLAALSMAYPCTAYLESYGCDTSGHCGPLKLSVSLMSNSTLMLDLSTHQALLTFASQLFAGCVKWSSNTSTPNEDQKDWHFLNSPSATVANNLLSHITKVLNAFCCILEDLNPLTNITKTPMVALPSPSALSPIRRKVSKAVEGVVTVDKEDVKQEDLVRKWNKPTQLLSPNNLGYFPSQPLYIKLYELLKGTYSTCKLNFDTATTERLSGFIQSLLDALATLLEVASFLDMGKHSEELLSYLRLIVAIEPVHSLYNVQQLLKSLFGANLAAVWRDEANRFKRGSLQSARKPLVVENQMGQTFFSSCGLHSGSTVISNPTTPSPRRAKISPSRERSNMIVKFRTSVGKMGPDKISLTSYIRLFEPMVIKALKLYTVTSSPKVQKQVLDLLCELIHLCVNYCLLDADQVFLNFVIQQFEFLEEGFIPQVEILLPSMFRFLSLLSYDRYHSKTIITVPRIMQLSGGLMATGKDAHLYVLPTLRPMVEDLFLSKERMSDNFKELEAQREVLISILLRLIPYQEVFPLLSVILTQVQSESTVKWKALSRQVCDVVVPQLQRHSMHLDSPEALQFLYKLFSRLDPPVVHESLLGLLQTFSSAQSEDSNYSSNPSYSRTLACRLAVMEALLLVFDEPFLLDCLNEFNLGYLVNENSDPLSVIPTENLSSEGILSRLIFGTLKSALNYWNSKVAADTNWSSCIPSKMDESSFAVRLVMDYVALTRRLLDSTDFPVLQSAISAQLKSVECFSELFRISRNTISNNPVIFLRICDLLPQEIQNLSPAEFHGLNGNIAQSGMFFVQCCQTRFRDDIRADFVKSYADQILRHIDATPVKELALKLAVRNDFFELLLKTVLEKRGELLVDAAVSLLGIMESLCATGCSMVISADSLLKVVSGLVNIPSGVVQCKLCKLIVQWWPSSTSTLNLLENLLTIIQNSKNQRYFVKLLVILREQEAYSEVNKAFVLDYALMRHQTGSAWKKIAVLLKKEDLPKLVTNVDALSSILSDCRTSNPVLYSAAKSWLFNEFLVDINLEDSSQVVTAAQILNCLLDSIRPAQIESTLTFLEIGLVAKLSLTFLAAMDSVYPATVLLNASSNIISIMRDEVFSEWSKPDNLATVYRAISSFEGFLMTVKSGTTCGPLKPSSDSINMDETTRKVVEYAQRLCRMITFTEEEFIYFPDVMRRDIQCVLRSLCRIPIFYSYVCIPPSVWNKGWDPKVELDPSHCRLNLPIIPSHFLHDELVLKEFVYRVDKIGWISRQKYEEIWMSLLGILNLSTEGEIRPEEQASIVQAMCEAVRALTMVLRKNLPFAQNDVIKKKSKKLEEFMQTERGEKLCQLYSLLDNDRSEAVRYRPICQFNRLTFNHIAANMDPGSPSKSKSVSPEDVSQIDIQSCVHFLVDLYAQWLKNSDTALTYPLLLELLRSLVEISTFFADRQHFEWMLESSINLQKQAIAEDPCCLEAVLTSCLLKSAAFASLNGDTWEIVKKQCDVSLSSPHISTRASGLDGIMYLLQRLTRNPDPSRAAALVNLTMEYIAKYLGSENVGPDWHQSWLWSLAFYCGEHFSELPYRSHCVIDFIVQCALNGLLETKKQSVGVQNEILQGLEDLCILDKLPPNWRRLVKKELINIIRNVEREPVLKAALRTLLSLVYSDFVNQLYKPGADPETMLMAMEWVGALLQRMKRGTDLEADLLGRIMPIITCDIFPPADILNRILNEFMTARPAVAFSLSPTIFKVFGTARDEGQQSLVLEWILLSLSNFTQSSSSGMTESVAVWNILCFFIGASRNPWLQSAFPLVSRPVDQRDSRAVQLFVASALDFRSQLDDKQKATLASIFSSAQEKSHFFAAAHAAFSQH